MAKDYKSILVAMDGSQQAEKAFIEAVDLAMDNQARLYIASVIDERSFAYDGYTSFSFADVIEDVKKSTEARLDGKIKEAMAAGVPEVTSIVEVSNPKKEIAREIPAKYDIDLIVIGATGRGAIQKNLVGSTTGYVVNNAECNVLVVR